MTWLVYLATVDGRYYVGITSKGLEERSRHHLYDAKIRCSQYVFHKALRKHDFAVQWTILADNIESAEKAMELERHYIAQYNSKMPNGFNMTDGGEGTPGWFVENETREKISETLKQYFADPDNRRRNSDSVKAALLNMPIDKKKQMLSNLKNSFTSEVRDRMSVSNKKFYKNNDMRDARAITRGSRPFLVFSRDGQLIGEWINKTRCCRELELGPPANLRKVLCGKSAHIKGYTAVYKDQYEQPTNTASSSNN